MRIAINGLFWGQESTGSGQYVQHLLPAMLGLAPENQYQLFTSRERGPEGPRSLPSVTTLRTPFTRWSTNLNKLWFEQVAFPGACLDTGADVAHVPYWGSPLRSPLPMVVTLHDLIPLLLPLYQGSPLVRLYTRLVAASAQRASLVITDSLASRADIIRCLHIPSDRIRVIYLAADPACLPVSDPGSLAALRAQYGLPGRYILYLGGFDQRKNLQALLGAYASLLAVEDDAPSLVVAGRLPSRHSELFPDPRRIARQLGIESRVLFTGWIPESDKPALYSGAVFFAFLSLYEGFGLMPLEAMACGTPVLAARTSSLPEIVGEGGLLVDPTDQADIVRGMSTLLDETTRQALRASALHQASGFSWARTARLTLEAYSASRTYVAPV